MLHHWSYKHLTLSRKWQEGEEDSTGPRTSMHNSVYDGKQMPHSFIFNGKQFKINIFWSDGDHYCKNKITFWQQINHFNHWKLTSLNLTSLWEWEQWMSCHHNVDISYFFWKNLIKLNFHLSDQILTIIENFALGNDCTTLKTFT